MRTPNRSVWNIPGARTRTAKDIAPARVWCLPGARARHAGLLKTDEKFRDGCGQPVSRALAAVDVRQAAARSHMAAHLAKRTLTSRTALERGRSKAPVPFLCGLTHATTVAARARSARG